MKEVEMRILVAAVAASLIAGSLNTVASADPVSRSEPIVTERVSYEDLDLNSAVGQKRLRDRLGFAAYRLCLVDNSASPSPAPELVDLW